MNKSLQENTVVRMARGALLVISLALSVHNVTAVERYVSVSSANPAPPFVTWATAARTIQEAVDAAMPGDEIVVTNGVYERGGSVVSDSSETNRVTVTKAVAIRSVNGPAVTTIRGFHDETPWVVPTNMGAWVRCIYLGAGARLSGFTLTNGGAATQGGGALCQSNTAVLSNCVIAGNRAASWGGGAGGGILNHCTLSENVAAWGGGAYSTTLNNCVLTGNGAGWLLSDDLVTLGYGGGAVGSVLNSCIVSNNGSASAGGVGQSTLYNCLVVTNGAGSGAGASDSTLVNCTVANNYGGSTHIKTGVGIRNCITTNCIVVDNRGRWEGLDNFVNSSLNYSCTSPMPAAGLGNITNSPLFVNPSAGDFRLQSRSPGIDAGLDLSATVTKDLAGIRRQLDGNRDGIAGFDMGAYEFNPLFLTSISKIGTNVQVCWFDNVAGMKLQITPSIIDGTWSDLAVPSNATCMELPLTGSNTFFRLILP